MKNIDIKISDIPLQFQDLAKEIGLSNFITLCSVLGGTLVYLPSLKTVKKNSRNKEILKNFNGANYKEISRKYQISEQYVRKLINKSKNEL